MKPFLLLATRAEDEAADGEYAAMLRYSGLSEAQLVRHRLEAEPLGRVRLDDWSGIIVGGGPFNVSDPASSKSAAQVRVEREIQGLLDDVVPRDFPFLGACYGIGTLGVRDGGVVDRTYGEQISGVTVALTDAGAQDPLFSVLPRSFEVYLGHKEAVAQLPGSAVVLASGTHCPVQAFRVGANVYATQFHPELDTDGILTRIEVYRHYGYFHPGEADEIKDRCRRAVVTEPEKLLARFVELYAR